MDGSETWVVASNKALTSQIGASSAADFGAAFGANVVFPKQLMLTTVADALRGGRTANMADRSKVEAELESALEGSKYEGLGWNVFDASDRLDPRVRSSIQAAISGFAQAGGPTSGDELTFFMSASLSRIGRSNNVQNRALRNCMKWKAGYVFEARFWTTMR